jgi:hypothetical protein
MDSLLSKIKVVFLLFLEVAYVAEVRDLIMTGQELSLFVRPKSTATRSRKEGKIA